MSPELETLDQLLGGDLPVAVVRSFYPDDERFILATLAMLNAGEIALLDAERVEVLKWDWPRFLTKSHDRCRLKLLDRGIERIG